MRPDDNNPLPPGGGHPDLLELELIRTGEAPPGTEEHLRGCPRCQEEVRRLGAVSAGLRTPGEAPVPDGIARRLDAAVFELIDSRAAAVAGGEGRGRGTAATVVSFASGRGRAFLTVAAGIAAAAAIVALTILSWPGRTTSPPSVAAASEAPAAPVAVATAPAAADADADGTVDIVDAYLIALRLESGQEVPPAWDLNTDGKIDRADAEWLAAQVVSLPDNGI